MQSQRDSVFSRRRRQPRTDNQDSGWIYRLGLKGTDGRYDRAALGLEFANELALDLDGDRLYAFGMNTPNTVYTGPFLTHEWRGFNFFAQFDEAQVDAGIELTLDICRRHDIEPVFYYPSTTYDFPRCVRRDPVQSSHVDSDPGSQRERSGC